MATRKRSARPRADTQVAGDISETPTPPRESPAAASPDETPGGSSDMGKPPETESVNQPQPTPWHLFCQQASDSAIRERFIAETQVILNGSQELAKTAVIAIFRPEDSLSSFDLDQVYEALMNLDPNAYVNIALFLLSRGGEIEPAYQISKLCRTFARGEKFLVVVPRQAKSAATLMSLGADEIHIGPLGQLGPIDPQIGGLPALGVSQALETIAGLVQQYPKSAEMFSQYLRAAVKVEHIGYSDRVAESAVQYAERLLASKPYLAARAPDIAWQLVYAYKDHSFVIDAEEAQRILGTEWIKPWSSLETVGESLYSKFDLVNFWLTSKRKKRLIVAGSFDTNGVFLLNI